MDEQRKPFMEDAAKFSTQRLVTYALLLIFTAVVANVLLKGDEAERSTIVQTVINFMTFVVGFWLGTSKSAADKDASATRILEANVPLVPIVPLGAPIKAKDVKVEAAGDVTVEKKP